MITANKGEIRLTGTESELLADYSTITKGLRETFAKEVGEDKAEELLQDAIRRSKETEDDLLMEILCLIGEHVSDLIKDIANK